MPYRKYLLIVLVLLWGCSTKKNTWLSRTFQNTTAHYNVYFNGNESYKAGIKDIEESYKDNYIKVLPMFEESDESSAGVASSSMDRAIDKGTKLIVRHSITARPKKKSGSSSKKNVKNRKEYNKWVDDALLMIGKAQVIKHEFRQAIRTFDLLIRDFSYEESKYKAMIWKARAYTELKDVNNARIAMESYDYDGKAPEHLYGEYMAVYANMLLVQERYKEAILFVQNAVDGANNKADRARYSFILGQIKQLTGDDTGAAIAYTQTLKNRPGYEMSFNAQIKRTSILYKNASLDEIKKQIKKMLRDKKNEDFRDQIYYALGKVYLNFDDEPEAIKSFKKSTEVSVDNDYQKTLSYLEIADIYFNKEFFKPAYQYYDSAMTIITEDFKDYNLISERHNSLQLLVEQLDIINNKDSLLMLADLSEAERDKFIVKIIETEKKRIKEEERLKNRGGDDYYGGGGGYQSMTRQAGGGKWYFYNVATKEMGKQEFARRWGKRKLADDWRRAKKGMVETSSDEPGEPGEPGEPSDNKSQQATKPGEATKTETSGGTTQRNIVPTKESLMADIPLTPELYRDAEFTRDISKFDAGIIYFERLKNYPKAIEMFEDCLASSTIPEEDQEDIYIALYKTYEASGDSVSMRRALTRLKNHFPESKFVQFIEDPNYLTNIETAKKIVDDEYASTYSNYLSGNYDVVIEKATNIELNDTSNIYMPKYLLIKALSYARKGDAELFKQNLETITTKHPGTEEAEYASLFIEQLDKGRSPVKSLKPYSSVLAQRLDDMSKNENAQQADAEPDMTGFLYAENEPHSFMAIPPTGADINRIIFNLADFNFSRYLVNDYGIETTLLPDKSTVILIKGFKNKLEGMDYFYSVREHEDKLFYSDSVKTKLYSISEPNLKFFLSSGQINNYDAFFNNLYLKLVDVEKLPEEMLPKTAKEIAKLTEQEVISDTTKVVTAIADSIPKVDSALIAPTPVVLPKDSAKANVTESAKATEEQKSEVKPAKPVKKQEVKTAEAAATVVLEKPEPKKKDSIPTPSPWVFIAGAQQDVIVIFKKGRIDYNKILKIYTNYTKNTYKNEELKVEMNDFIEGFKYISVTGFKSKKEAKAFLDELRLKSFLIRDIKNREYYLWVITPQNRATLEQNKDLKGYDTFFEKEY